jgi:hypothetical protein
MTASSTHTPDQPDRYEAGPSCAVGNDITDWMPARSSAAPKARPLSSGDDQPGSRAITAPSIWFPAPDYGKPDATVEELAAEPEDVKALRMLRVLRAYAGQDIHPFSAVKLDGHELVVLRLSYFTPIIDAVCWLREWQQQAVDLMQAINTDLEHELVESGHAEALLALFELCMLEHDHEEGDDQT